MAEKKMILLEAWAERLSPRPALFTLRKWAREALIDPAPIKVGRDYYVAPDATPPVLRRGTLRACVAAAPTSLYRHFDGEGRLLYVGVSLAALGRTADHQRLAPWFSQVRTITVEPHPDRASALAAEARAIREDAPVHNTAGRAPAAAGTP